MKKLHNFTYKLFVYTVLLAMALVVGSSFM